MGKDCAREVILFYLFPLQNLERKRIYVEEPSEGVKDEQNQAKMMNFSPYVSDRE